MSIGSSDQQCFPNTGATNHMTADAQSLGSRTEYLGNDHIVVGNGSQLPITHTGTTTIHTPFSSIPLRNVLCVPDIKKNLLSRFFRGPPGPNCQRCSLAGGMFRLMLLFKSICRFGISFACPVTSSFSKIKSRNSVFTPYPKGQGLFLRCEYGYLFLSFTLTKGLRALPSI